MSRLRLAGLVVLLSIAQIVSAVVPAFGANFAFRRQAWIVDGFPRNPAVVNLEASATANGDSYATDPNLEGTDVQESLAHATVAAMASDMGAFAEADNMGTAAVLTPIGATTFGPTVDSTYFLRAVASNDLASAASEIDEGVVEAPAVFQAEAQDWRRKASCTDSYI